VAVAVDSDLSRRAPSRSRAAAIVVVALLVAGLAARFIELDRHYYFRDEAVTSLRVSGFTNADFDRFVTDHEVTAAQIERYQRPSGDLAATVHSLALNDPQHPPLFYVLARLWAGAFGASIVSLRLLAALVSLLALAAAGWLARELFSSRRTAWLAMALLAVSPFQILYAREAREYGLWVAAVAASSAALLFALRERSRRAWTLYAVLVAVALYTFPNSALVVGGHAVFLLLRDRRRDAIRSFALAAVSAVILYLPWIGVMVLQRGALAAGTDWTKGSVSATTLLRSWLVASGLPVLDKPGTASLDGGWAVALGLVLVLEASSLLVLRRHAPRAAWLFIATLIAATVLPLVLADVIAGGVRSTVPRFVAPAYLGLSLALAFVLSEASRSASTARRLVGAGVLLAVVAAAAVSYGQSAFAPVWWNQDDGQAATNVAVAHVLEHAERPLLLTVSSPPLLELAHYVKPSTGMRVDDAGSPPLPPAGGHVFLYGLPSDPRVIALLASGGRWGLVPLVKPCCGAGDDTPAAQLWQLRR